LTAPAGNTCLHGVRVLELANELGEHTGKVLAGLGADVVKVEPPEGEATRHYGPFYRDEPHHDRSLCFWSFNLGKRGITLDLDSAAGQAELAALARVADVLVDTRPARYLEERGLAYANLAEENPGLVYLRVTPFGEEGPWAGFEASDLVHLALGGMMSNSGYDPDPDGFYETPPIAPQPWLAYQTAGELAAMSVLAALIYRDATGRGQYLSASVHQANAVSTELDMPYWVVQRTPVQRQTGRHARPALTLRSIARTKDGRYLVPYTTYVRNFPSSWELDIATLRKYGMEADLGEAQWEDADYRAANQGHIADVIDTLIARTTFDAGLWREMLDAGATWAPVRKPEENLDDEHWRLRSTFSPVEHPELDDAFEYVTARWVSEAAPWSAQRRAPLLGEHNAEIRDEWLGGTRTPPLKTRSSAPEQVLSKHGKPFALSGLRVLDLGWMLASAGAGRFLAALGAEVIKIEHSSRFDGMRFAGITYPPGGRAERDAATTPIQPRKQESPSDSASFNEINSGKLALSLDLREPRGKEILQDLVRAADVLLEGFSPGTMDRLGLGYLALRQLNPRLVHVHQSGLGQKGVYGRARAFGPTAQGFSGLTEMSGLASPWPPAGIGYSYLDWLGAYNMATAALAAVHGAAIAAEGAYIDASQTEIGIYLASLPILDFTVNGRPWARHGNRSPYKPAAPNGAYRAAGADRWVAITNFTEAHWQATAEVLGTPSWMREKRFATLMSRLRHQDELDAAVNGETAKWDRFELMYALQARGVPAGVVQSAEDRVDHDPQLLALGWQVELRQTDQGWWPVRELPVRFSETPAYIGGLVDRMGPNYGEDTGDVLRRVLGYSDAEIASLRTDGIV
jgi:crotonobetainyl-CoA:carnitine CoA-transferase CaiB-like acyl-CoA transferase